MTPAVDLARTDGLHAWVRAVVQSPGPICGLVNNVALGHDGVLTTMHERQIDELLRVNIEAPMPLAPGCLQTDMTAGLQGDKLHTISWRSPLGRLATVEDGAAAVVCLLSDDAGSTA